MPENKDWETVIGIEVHCQILSKSKLFSRSSTEFGCAENENVSFIDAAFPGTLPSLNEECVKQAVKTGLALQGKINKFSMFDRKNYFYPDLPSGYQITQFYKPIMENGKITINVNGKTKDRHIDRLHMEQDAGKMIHDLDQNSSLVDLNRAGVGLMEIVSKPDLSSSLEAMDYVTKLRSIVRYIGSCDGNMEQGSLRCDINISVRKKGEKALRTRVEVKNVNSIKFMSQAIEYEVARQIAIWEKGEEVQQETRLYDANSGKTYSMRSKQEAVDYRYFPDPDLPPLVLSDEFIAQIKKQIPELPEEKKDRLMKEFGLSQYDAMVLTLDKDNANFFEQVMEGKKFDGKLAASFIINVFFAYLNKNNITVSKTHITPAMLQELLAMIKEGVLSSRTAKDVFEIMQKETNKTPKQIVKDNNLEQITDNSAIEKIINELIDNNLDKVLAIKDGKDKMMGWFVGQVMAKTDGKANPALVNTLLKAKIDEK